MLSWAFARDLKGYSLSSLRKDILAAFSIALFVIPQSIAYSLLAGLPPIAGLYSAIFGTLFASWFSSSKRMISGPSTAMAILIQTSIAGTIGTYYPGVVGAAKETLVFHLLIQILFMAGVIQIVLAFCNVSKVLQFISRPVVLGYFTGLALVVVIQQLFHILGITPPGGQIYSYKFYYLMTHLHNLHLMPLFAGLLSLGLLVGLKKRFPTFPAPLFLIVVTGGLAYSVNSILPAGEQIQTLGALGSFHFTPVWNIPLFNWSMMQKLFPAAAAIALLGILEVFSASKVLSAKKGERVDLNQEVFSVGTANFFLSFIQGAMPASASISRTTLNCDVGAKTRLAGIFSSMACVGALYFSWGYLSLIPLTALSALLILSILSIIDFEQIKLCFRATKEDAFVFLFTVVLCFVFTLDVAFIVGIVISIASYLRKAAEPHFVEYAFNQSGRLSLISPEENKHRKVRILGVGGELFFGAVDIFQKALHEVSEDPHVNVIVLRLNGVYRMDASMCYALLHFHEYLTSTGRHLVISGLNEKVWNTLTKSKLIHKIGKDNFFLSDEARPQLSTWKACLRAQELIPLSLKSKSWQVF